ncbi:MAG: hypothetical protein ACRC10_03780 [Thermoguttaceae bacterium]
MTLLTDQEFAREVLDKVCVLERFEPFVFNNEEGDCLEFFVSPNDYYGERVDDYLTLYLDMETGEVVGFVVKKIRQILKRLSKRPSALTFIVKDNRVRLNCLFAAMFADPDQSVNLEVRAYRRVADLAESNHLAEIEYSYV